MKKILRVLVLLLTVIIVGGGAFVATYKPKQRPAQDVRVAMTPENVARGDYLVNHVTMCFECHSQRDWSLFGAPGVPPKGGGGDTYTKAHDVPGTLTPRNITPHKTEGIGAWTDGEIIRAIREGVDKDGKALFPFMPYEMYCFLSDADVQAIVAYLRSLPPSDRHVEPAKIDFPVSFFGKLAPKPLTGPIPPTSPSDHLAYGKYLATVAGCKLCHTPVDDTKHLPIPGMDYSGGQVLKGPHGTHVVSANITPDPSGIGNVTKEGFLALFASFRDWDMDTPVSPERQTYMPWLSYRGMTDEDLGAIYDYLRTVPAIKNDVVKFPLAGDDDASRFEAAAG